MLALFGDAKGGLPPSSASPRVILMLGLQGSGKTTTTAKLAQLLTKQGRHPIMVSTDVRRPAAIKQLTVLGEAAGCGSTIRRATSIRCRGPAARWPRRRTSASTPSSSTPPAACTSTTS